MSGLPGLLDAYIAMIRKVHGDSTSFVYCLWCAGCGPRSGQSWTPQSVFSLGNGVSSVETWFSIALNIEEVLSGAGCNQLHVMDVIKSFDTVDRSILDCALGRRGFSSWFRSVCLAFYS